MPQLTLHIDNRGERDLRLVMAAIAWGTAPNKRSALVWSPGSFEEVTERRRGPAPFLLASKNVPEFVPANDSVAISFNRNTIEVAGLDLDDPDIIAEVHVGRRTYRARGIRTHLR